MLAPFWIVMKQEVMWWQWHQVDHIQIICTLLQTDATQAVCDEYRLNAAADVQPTVSEANCHVVDMSSYMYHLSAE